MSRYPNSEPADRSVAQFPCTSELSACRHAVAYALAPPKTRQASPGPCSPLPPRRPRLKRPSPAHSTAGSLVLQCLRMRTASRKQTFWCHRGPTSMLLCTSGRDRPAAGLRQPLRSTSDSALPLQESSGCSLPGAEPALQTSWSGHRCSGEGSGYRSRLCELRRSICRDDDLGSTRGVPPACPSGTDGPRCSPTGELSGCSVCPGVISHDRAATAQMFCSRAESSRSVLSSAAALVPCAARTGCIRAPSHRCAQPLLQSHLCRSAPVQSSGLEGLVSTERCFGASAEKHAGQRAQALLFSPLPVEDTAAAEPVPQTWRRTQAGCTSCIG